MRKTGIYKILLLTRLELNTLITGNGSREEKLSQKKIIIIVREEK